MASSLKIPIVDIHTHFYPPTFMNLLTTRTTLPYVRHFPSTPSSTTTSPRLIILPGEEDSYSPSDPTSPPPGRPLGPDYHDIQSKIAFMDTHGIDTSVISLANPWLDFLSQREAGPAARAVNDELNDLCAQHPGRLFAFGALPLSGGTETIVAEIERLSTMRYMRGVIIGTSGLGQGLDDLALDPIYAALQTTKTLVFLHPHYGLPASVYGPRAAEYGHVLPLALGFPLETTIAVARMVLSGVWDRFAGLKVLLAHSGGTLPFLAGRIESCILHDGVLMGEGREKARTSVWDILRDNIYLDAVVYSEVGLRAAVQASGADRVLFGTDHPFFPPVAQEEEEEIPAPAKPSKWLSVTTNYRAIQAAFPTFHDPDHPNAAAARDVLGGNAVRILRLDEGV
ncbi:MAG: hypothetical protein M1819_000348 [Sarea resinae]|nr:MAG: hypothetical protein M1819_000348 [Sarea resinae]